MNKVINNKVKTKSSTKVAKTLADKRSTEQRIRRAHARQKRLAEEIRRVSQPTTIFRKTFTRMIHTRSIEINDIGRLMRKTTDQDEMVGLYCRLESVFYAIVPDVFTESLIEIEKSGTVTNYEEIRA